LDNRCHHKLSDAIAALNANGLCTEVDRDHTHFASVVGIDRPGRIYKAQAFANRAA
jgi:hypothetical protein